MIDSSERALLSDWTSTSKLLRALSSTASLGKKQGGAAENLTTHRTLSAKPDDLSIISDMTGGATLFVVIIC